MKTGQEQRRISHTKRPMAGALLALASTTLLASTAVSTAEDATRYKQIREVWNPIQVLQHYDIPAGTLSGKGQKVAIMALGQPPNEAVLRDLIEQASNNRYKGTFKVEVLPGDRYEGPPPTQTGEYAMDAQIIGCLCPNADITIFVGGESFQGMANVISAATESGHKVITSSVGFPEDTAGRYPNTSLAGVKAIQQSLVLAKANNVTVFSASGDSGSGGRVGNHAYAEPGKQVHVGILNTQALVVSCGGTELRNENGKAVETTWNNSNLHLDNLYGAAGAGTGGVSKLVPLPSWQNAHSKIVNANTKKTGRIVPDVSGAAAFVDWKIFEAQEDRYGRWSAGSSPSGGTSAVAPFYAAVFTLINEQRAASGKKPAGFVNEWLYENAAKLKMFNDITQGDCRPKASYNKSTKTFTLLKDPYPGYDAGPGFDACSGLGTPNGKVFFDALVNK